MLEGGEQGVELGEMSTLLNLKLFYVPEAIGEIALKL
jgi:hypothetical protein